MSMGKLKWDVTKSQAATLLRCCTATVLWEPCGSAVHAASPAACSSHLHEACSRQLEEGGIGLRSAGTRDQRLARACKVVDGRAAGHASLQ